MAERSHRAFALLVGTIVLAAAAQTQAMLLVDTQGGVEVWSVPQAVPGPGFVATKLVLKATSPSATLATFENLAVGGDLVQTWISGPSGTPTAKGEPLAGPNYAAEWIPFDSHLLIDPSEVGGEVGGGYTGISEVNDDSIGAIPGLPTASGFPPTSGIGAIMMASPTDAFFLQPASQLNQVDFAYLVTQTGAGNSVTITLGVLGAGIVNSGQPGGAQWGSGDNPEPLVIPFPVAAIPEPATVWLGLLAVAGVAMRRRTA